MTIAAVTDRTPALMAQLVAVWEGSVRATHDFLTEDEIQAIKTYVPQALAAVEHLVVAYEAVGQPVAFMGCHDQQLEMLFVAPSQRGQGLGKQLLTVAMQQYQVTQLVVNEQNPQARGFYEHCGFHVVRRSAVDEQGQPYPILVMARASV